MPTEHDFYEALNDGRWQPELKYSEDDKGYKVSYDQGDGTVVEKVSVWSISQAEGDLLEELREGVLEGKYFPVQG